MYFLTFNSPATTGDRWLYLLYIFLGNKFFSSSFLDELERVNDKKE